MELVKKNRNSWAISKTPDVLLALYRSALRGDAKSQKLWLQYFGDSVKKDPKEKEYRPISPDDILSQISLLPEYRKKLHNKFFIELLYDVTFFQKIRSTGGEMTEAQYNEYHEDRL